MRKRKRRQAAKFKVGQVVRVYAVYFAIERREYSSDRVALWDNGWWYWNGNSCYGEHAIHLLTNREAGQS